MDLASIKDNLIGEYTTFTTPYGDRMMTYADYTASGRSLKFIEDYMLKLQAFYANSHTEDSTTGAIMTSLVKKSEQKIKAHFNALDDYIIPTGTGATGAIAKLSEIMGFYIAPKMRDRIEKHISKCGKINTIEDMMGDDRPVVFIGPYEHHSNDLVWRESIAQVVEINLNQEGDICLVDLEAKLSDPQYQGRIKLGSFSAGSNVTGLKTPIYDIARLLHQYDAFAAFDFAGSGPYMCIDMNKDDQAYFDAIYLSPHKFIGGPGSTGLLLINKALYNEDMAPTVAGGGTVDYVSSFGYEFSHDVETREMAGTPGILQIIRAALVIELKEKIGVKTIVDKEHEYMQYVFNRLKDNPDVEIFGNLNPEKRVSIMSFNLKSQHRFLHHRLVSTLLNDLFGIQSRAGCACAGPYGHRLLGIDEHMSMQYRDAIKAGVGALKPGWVRVNFHYTMTHAEVEFIVSAIEFIAQYGYLFLEDYALNVATGLWTHRHNQVGQDILNSFGIEAALDLSMQEDPVKPVNKSILYAQYLDDARRMAHDLLALYKPIYLVINDPSHDALRWFDFAYESVG